MTERLRIALVAPIAGPVGPDCGSSIEHLVWLLGEALGEREHDVTLFATGDSTTSARLIATYGCGYHHDDTLWNWELHEIMHHAAVFEQAQRFDVIHTHSYHYGLPFTRLVETPVVHTYHIDPDQDVLRCYACYPEAQLVAVSQHHRTTFAPLDVPFIYNGIDVDAFPFNPCGGDYLMFLGHLIPKKGALEAIKIARWADMRLIMAGHGGDYYRQHVAPYIDGDQIKYVGMVSVEERNQLLANAAALLFPSVHKEPFGLVMVEAMACGTPVLALDRCAVPEIVEPGVTGYYSPDSETLAAFVPKVMQLDRCMVRETVALRFDHRRMAANYEALYREVIHHRDTEALLIILFFSVPLCLCGFL